MGAFKPVRFVDVALEGEFWCERLETVLTKTIPSQHVQLGKHGILEALTLPSPPPGLEESGSMAGMDMGGTPAAGDSGETPLMPGMATQSEVDELKTLPPAEMDLQFLRLMIRHHEGGVLMAEAALEKAEDEHVLGFAQQVVNTQSAEIKTMTEMLEARMAGTATPAAGTPVATPEPMDMPGMATPAEGH